MNPRFKKYYTHKTLRGSRLVSRKAGLLGMDHERGCQTTRGNLNYRCKDHWSQRESHFSRCCRHCRLICQSNCAIHISGADAAPFSVTQWDRGRGHVSPWNTNPTPPCAFEKKNQTAVSTMAVASAVLVAVVPLSLWHPCLYGQASIHPRLVNQLLWDIPRPSERLCLYYF